MFCGIKLRRNPKPHSKPAAKGRGDAAAPLDAKASLDSDDSTDTRKCQLVELTYDDLRDYTNDFSEENFLGKTQFGKLYRGRILQHQYDTEGRQVTVKTWEHPVSEFSPPYGEMCKLSDELCFLQHPPMKNHPNLVKLIGYSCKSKPLGVVYDLSPLDTLHNLALKDDFTWSKRIKVALDVVRLLIFLQYRSSPYMLRNMDPTHIMIDKDYNPVVFDFGLITGGIFGFRKVFEPGHCKFAVGPYDYGDIAPLLYGCWSNRCDVYPYGVLLLSLITKRVINREWCVNVYQDKNEFESNMMERRVFSRVQERFKGDPDYDWSDGLELTRLGLSCIESSPGLRPVEEEIATCIQNLHVAQTHDWERLSYTSSLNGQSHGWESM